MKIHWNKNIQPENKAEIEKYLDPLTDFIPAWCQELIVSLYSGNNTDASIETKVNYDYRNIELDFYSTWLLNNAEDKQLELLHEFIHFFISPLYTQCYRIIKHSDYSDSAKQALINEIKITNESITQDLAFAIGNKFGNGRENLKDILTTAAESEEGLYILREFYDTHPTVKFIVK